ncbi:hypothetical protein OROMI_014524 [Orobanche minor]
MAERSPFPFTACLDHAHFACREVVTLSANCSFKSEKSSSDLDCFSIRETCPDEIPVIVQKADGSQIPYAKNKLHIPADSNLADLFVEVWKQIFRVKLESKTYSLFMLLKYKDPVFKKLVSAVYEEYKDEDGNLCLTLSGKIKDILPQPSPSNISARTFYVYNMPSNIKLYQELNDGWIDLFYEYMFKKCMKDDWFRELECSKCLNPNKLIFYLAATGLEYKKENIKKFRQHIKQFRASGQLEERIDIGSGTSPSSAPPEINNNNRESENKYKTF